MESYSIFAVNDKEFNESLEKRNNNIFADKSGEYYYKPVSKELEDVIKKLWNKEIDFPGLVSFLKIGETPSVITINNKTYVFDKTTEKWGQQVKNRKYIYPGHQFFLVTFNEKNGKYRMIYFKYDMDLAMKSFNKIVIPQINKIISKFKHNGIQLHDVVPEQDWNSVKKSGLKYEWRKNKFILTNRETCH